MNGIRAISSELWTREIWGIIYFIGGAFKYLITGKGWEYVPNAISWSDLNSFRGNPNSDDV